MPLVRERQLGNKLAVATAAIFFSCAAGHFSHYLMASPQGVDGMAAPSMSTWWTASAHAVTACVALYYLTLRGSYGRLLDTAPMYDDLTESSAKVCARR